MDDLKEELDEALSANDMIEELSEQKLFVFPLVLLLLPTSSDIFLFFVLFFFFLFCFSFFCFVFLF